MTFLIYVSAWEHAWAMHGSGGAMVTQVSCFLPPVGPGNHVIRLGIEPFRQPAPRLEGFFMNVNF